MILLSASVWRRQEINGTSILVQPWRQESIFCRPKVLNNDAFWPLSDCVTPPGTYVDAYPLHMMTTNSLQYLTEQGNVAAVKERFRPNLLIEPSQQSAQMTENDWVGHRLQVGEVVLRVHNRTVRCSMPSRQQQWCDVKAEPKMARAMVDHCDRHLGVYVMVEKGGVISAGDDLVLID